MVVCVLGGGVKEHYLRGAVHNTLGHLNLTITP